MGIIDKLCNDNLLYTLITILLVIAILYFSGDIINSIFEIGRTLGSAIGNVLFK